MWFFKTLKAVSEFMVSVVAPMVLVVGYCYFMAGLLMQGELIVFGLLALAGSVLILAIVIARKH